MRTYRLTKTGSVDGLIMTEEEQPTPGNGEVLVRIRATSLNFRDFLILQGWMPFEVPLGGIPLSDASGEVVSVGAGVKRFKTGDRVVNSCVPGWYAGKSNELHEQYGIQLNGWSTDFRVVNELELVKLPAYLSFEEGATLPCAAVTAWSSLAGIGPANTVLTLGSGGVSLFALQLAKASGARVIATTSTPEKATRLSSLGADEVIDYRKNPEWSAQVRTLTGGRGVDRIVEVGGPGTISQSIKAVAVGGQISLVGALAQAEGGIDFMSMFMSQAAIQPIGIGSRRDLEEMISAMEQHEIHPIVDRVFAMEEAKAAWTYFGNRQLFGKVVIRH